MDPSPPDFSVHGILQARMVEWVAITSARGSSWPREQTHISYVSWNDRQVLYTSAIWEDPWVTMMPEISRKQLQDVNLCHTVPLKNEEQDKQQKKDLSPAKALNNTLENKNRNWVVKENLTFFFLIFFSPFLCASSSFICFQGAK